MPFLAVVHLCELRCPECGALLAEPGARSFIVDDEGSPLAFGENAPEAMRVEVACPNGHTAELLIPNEVAAEEALTIPDEAPIGADARLMNN
ncbi:MAG: hypothetical protein JO199_14065 [Candidatus Eremiobacteraeota bacterium]|nr:hypothetical protein [Candidatus Eremiobacteraeota bacterium]